MKRVGLIVALAGLMVAVGTASAQQDEPKKTTRYPTSGGVRLPERAPRIEEGVVLMPKRYPALPRHYPRIGGPNGNGRLTPPMPTRFANPFAPELPQPDTSSRDGTPLPATMQTPREASEAEIARAISALREGRHAPGTTSTGTSRTGVPDRRMLDNSIDHGPFDGGIHTMPDMTLQSYYTPPSGEAPRVQPPAARERGLAMLAEGRAAHARAALRDHLSNDPEDAEAGFAMGIAAALAGEAASGVASIAEALWIDGELVGRADLLDDLLPRTADRRKLTQALVPHAERARTGEAYLAAAFSVHAMGNTGRALDLLRKGEQAGLDADLAARIAAAWAAPRR
ncbi:MAG: hypothetical protein KIS87_05785 [Phycisphaeraceae bacterium]|nr:hypothetical protein [Phycisphaeraceae bacterium]